MTLRKRLESLAMVAAILLLLAGLACNDSSSPSGPGNGDDPDPTGNAPDDWGLTAIGQPDGGWGYAVWAVSEDLAYAGGAENVIVWDGESWRPSLHVTGLFVHDMFALGPDAVYAVGTDLYRYDGAVWEDMNLPATCWTVWGAAEDDLWACGNAHVYHWDGAAWTDTPLGSYTLWSIWGAGTDDVFVVGNVGEIFHWDGAAWSAMTSGTSSNLWDVWGFAADDVWAASLANGLLHWDGAAWSVVTAEAEAAAIWGAATDDIWAVAGGNSLMHWDGAAWSSPQEIDAFAVQSLDGAGGRLFGAGYSLGMWEAGAWTPQLWTSNNQFEAVGGTGADNLVAAEGRYFWTWDGDGWDSQYLSALPYTAHLVWSGAPGQDVIACYGTIAYRNGGDWQVLGVGTDNARCAWGTAAGGVWLGCDDGKLYHTDGGAAPVLTQTAASVDIEGLFGLADDAIWAVGRAGTLLKYDGAAWTALDAGTPGDLYAVFATADDDLWVAGDNGLCRHWDGAAWTAYDFTGLDINRLLGWDEDGIVAVGDGGLFRWDGAAWTETASGDVFDIEDAYLAPDGSTLAIDQAGWLYMGLAE